MLKQIRSGAMTAIGALDALYKLLGRLLLLAAILLCTFGHPQSVGLYGPAAEASCVLLGLTLLVAACVSPFIKQPIVAPERQAQLLTALMLVAGILCLYVGGRWTWSLW